MQWITKNGKHIPVFNKSIRFSKKVYGKLCHEIDSNGNEEEKKIDKINVKNIGDYAYIYYYSDINPIIFYGKLSIEKNSKKIAIIREYLK